MTGADGSFPLIESQLDGLAPLQVSNYRWELRLGLTTFLGFATLAGGAADWFAGSGDSHHGTDYRWVAILVVGAVVLLGSLFTKAYQKEKGPVWQRILRDPTRIQAIVVTDHTTFAPDGTEHAQFFIVGVTHPFGKAEFPNLEDPSELLSALQAAAPHAVVTQSASSRKFRLATASEVHKAGKTRDAEQGKEFWTLD